MAKEKAGIKQYDFASTDLLIYIWEKRWPLAIITVAAGIISILVSFTITPKFKSSLVIYPTANGFISTIDHEVQAEQLLQVIISDEVKNRVVEKNNLMEHYKIDAKSAYPRTDLDNAYYSNVRVRKTEYGSIQLDVLDKDPQMAADIANDISSFTDTVYNNILRTKSKAVLPIVEREYFDFLKTFQELKDSMDMIRSYGINNYGSQADRYHQSYASAILSGNEKAMKVLDEKFKILAKYGGTYEILNMEFGRAVEQNAHLKERYRLAQSDVKQTYPHQFVVNTAFRADKKAYPKKSTIVIVSALSAFLLGLILLRWNENLKNKLQ